MPTNANTFNSRVTSEALEKKFRDVFPAQGGAELVQDLYASGVVQPVIDFSSVAEGSVLPAELQQAWDFATDYDQVVNTITALVSTPGFWKVDLSYMMTGPTAGANYVKVYIDNGLTTKTVFHAQTFSGATNFSNQNEFIVYLRAGDTLRGQAATVDDVLDVWYRQIADVNGNLVNPLGFTFS